MALYEAEEEALEGVWFSGLRKSFAPMTQRYQQFLDKVTPHTAERWYATGFLAFVSPIALPAEIARLPMRHHSSPGVRSAGVADIRILRGLLRPRDLRPESINSFHFAARRGCPSSHCQGRRTQAIHAKNVGIQILVSFYHLSRRRPCPGETAINFFYGSGCDVVEASSRM